jgi:DNA recombination protein RmuC
MQYPFPDGTIVDAVVFVKDKIIPIDSKFSLENYNKMVEEDRCSRKEKIRNYFCK